MSMVTGKVGTQELKWLSIPKGPSGTARVEIGGTPLEVRWARDASGIWIELSDGVYGFDVSGEIGDEGGMSYVVNQRGSSASWSGISFARAGEEAMAAAAGGKKKGARVKAQMPGKIVRVLVKSGDAVTKGQSLLVMEAMKMENEIRAGQDGRVGEIKVKEGQAVESGAELLTIESA